MDALQACGPCPSERDDAIEGGILSRWIVVQEWVDHDGSEWLHATTGQGDGTCTPPWWTEGALGYAFRDTGDDD